MGYNLLINGIYRGYNPLILTIYYLPGTSQWDHPQVFCLIFFCLVQAAFFLHGRVLLDSDGFRRVFFENLVNSGRVKWAELVVYGI